MLSNLIDKIVPSASLAISEKAKKKGGVINLSVGQPDFRMPENVNEAVRRAIKEGKTRYTNSRGVEELREAIVIDIKRKYGFRYDIDQIIVTPGGKQAILTSLQSLLNEGDEVISFEPCWHSYRAMVTIAGGKYIPVSSLESIGEINVTEKTKVILLNNPVNPTSNIWSKEDLERVAFIAKENDLWVIADEIYDEILYDNNEFISFPSLYDKTILINGFSKTYAMCGLRIAYIAGPKEFITGALKIHQHSSTCACSLSQYAALEALQPQTREYVDYMVKEYQKRKDLVTQGFDCLKIKGAFYAFIKVKGNSLEAADFLLEKANIASIPGIAFGDSGEGYVRISFAAPYEDLEKAIENYRKII